MGGGRLGGTRGERRGFRVEVVISWYGGEACSRSVSQSDGRYDVKGSNGIEGMRCGSKVGLWHFDFGRPWAVDARSSLRGMEKNPQGWAWAERYLPICARVPTLVGRFAAF